MFASVRCEYNVFVLEFVGVDFRNKISIVKGMEFCSVDIEAEEHVFC